MSVAGRMCVDRFAKKAHDRACSRNIIPQSFRADKEAVDA